MTTHKPPSGLHKSGKALWAALTDAYDLEQHELGLLLEACRTVDQLDQLQAAVDRDGVLAESSQGARAHPALVEARQQRIALARLLAALRVPAGEEDGRGRGRGTPRGVYGIAQ